MASTARRSSTRERNAPENFTNDNSLDLTGNKSTLMGDSDASLSESDPESDYENSNPNKTFVASTAKKAAKPKSTVKRARKAGTTPRRAGAGSAAPSSSAANLSFASASSSVNMSLQSAHKGNALLASLYTGTSSTLSLAGDLISSHNADPNAAQCDLVNLLFRCVGGSPLCELDAEAHNLENITDEEWAEKLTDVVADMQDADAAKVLVAAVDPKKRTKAQNKFVKTYKEFWRNVASTAMDEGAGATSSGNSEFSAAATPTSARVDVDLVNTLVLRVTEIVSVGQPDIRHASCVAAFEMADAVLGKVKSLEEKLAKTERQLAAVGEKTKRGESLKLQVSATNRVITDLTALVSETIFNIVFMHRYRDSNEHTRALCLDYLSNWMTMNPSTFLEDKYLKYFAWMLHDASPHVRIAALKALNAPFAYLDANPSDDSINLDHMKNVSVKFLPHLADLTIDVDPLVQPHSITFLLSLLREGFLDDFEDENLWDQINFRSLDPKATPEMRRVSLQFVIEQLEAFDDGEDDDDDATSTPAAKSSKSKVSAVDDERTAVAKIDALASWAAHALTGDAAGAGAGAGAGAELIRTKTVFFLIESLRSLPEFAPLATNWKALLRAIDEDSSATTAEGDESADVSDVAKQRVLVRMLMSAVKLEVGDAAATDFLEGTKAKISGSKKSSKKSAAAHTTLSNSLLASLPSLLSKFTSDTHALATFAKLPRYLLPSVFNNASKKTQFTALLKGLSALFLRSSDDGVLNAVGMSLRHLTTSDHSRTDDAKLAVQEIVTNLRKKVKDVSKLTLTTGAVVTPAKKGKKATKATATTSVTRDSEYAFGLALQQLRVLTKKVDPVRYFEDEDGVGSFVKNLLDCADVRVSSAASQGDPSILSESLNVVCEALEIAEQTVGWMMCPLHDAEEKRGEKNNDKDENLADAPDAGDMSDASDASDGEVDVKVIARIRDAFLALSEKIFAQEVPGGEGDDAEAEAEAESPFGEFVLDTQEVAMKCVSDIRSLFPRSLEDCSGEALRSLALDDAATLFVQAATMKEKAAKIPMKMDGSAFAPAKAIYSAKDLTYEGAENLADLLKKCELDAATFTNSFSLCGHVASTTNCANAFVPPVAMSLASASPTFKLLDFKDQHHTIMLAAKYVWFSRNPTMRNKGKNWHSFRPFWENKDTSLVDGLNDLFNFLDDFVKKVTGESFENTMKEGVECHESNKTCYEDTELSFLKRALKGVEINEKDFKEQFKFLLENIPTMYFQAVHWSVYQNLRPPLAIQGIAFVFVLSGTKYVSEETILDLHLDIYFNTRSSSDRMDFLADFFQSQGVETFVELFAYLERRGGTGGLTLLFGGKIDLKDQVNAASESYEEHKTQKFTTRAKLTQFVKVAVKKGTNGVEKEERERKERKERKKEERERKEESDKRERERKKRKRKEDKEEEEAPRVARYNEIADLPTLNTVDVSCRVGLRVTYILPTYPSRYALIEGTVTYVKGHVTCVSWVGGGRGLGGGPNRKQSASNLVIIPSLQADVSAVSAVGDDRGGSLLQCSWCSKTFAGGQALGGHIRVHRHEPDYPNMPKSYDPLRVLKKKPKAEKIW